MSFNVDETFERNITNLQRKVALLHCSPDQSLVDITGIPLAIIKDNGKDFATAIDSVAEDIFKSELKKLYPQLGFLGEETQSTGDDARYVIICDPLDGSSVYGNGGKYYCSSIALADRQEGKVVFGSVMQSATGLQFIRQEGKRPIVRQPYLSSDGSGVLERFPTLSSSKFLGELEVCAFGTSKYHDQIPGIKDRLAHVFDKVEFPEYKRKYGMIDARPGSGASALYLCDIADGRKHAALLFFQAAWDMAVGAPYAKDAGCIVRYDNQNNPDIRSWSTEGLEDCIAKCNKKSLINVAVFANPDVERLVLDRFYS